MNFSYYTYRVNTDYSITYYTEGGSAINYFTSQSEFTYSGDSQVNIYGVCSFNMPNSINVYRNNQYVYNWNTFVIQNSEHVPPEPEVPSGEPSGDIGSGTITNPSGEITGNIDLSGIENGISKINSNLNNIENKIPTSGEIQNVISGEIGKVTETLTTVPDISNTEISSGEIIDSLGFELASDRYSNFWLTLTNNLKSALLGVNRTIQITFQGNTWTISLDDFAILPAWLIIIITPFSTCFFVWILAKWWKLIINKLTSGNVDSLLKENSQEGITNMF